MDKTQVNTTYTFIPATKTDTAKIICLIKELAEYEKLAKEVTVDEKTLSYWLFEKKTAEVLLVKAERIIGFVLYFYNFSTFLGKPGIYIEDLYIKPAYRNKGIGKALMLHLAKLTLAKGCGRLEWSCLNWNQPSIAFYHKLEAKPLDDWTTFRLDETALKKLLK